MNPLVKTVLCVLALTAFTVLITFSCGCGASEQQVTQVATDQGPIIASVLAHDPNMSAAVQVLIGDTALAMTAAKSVSPSMMAQDWQLILSIATDLLKSGLIQEAILLFGGHAPQAERIAMAQQHLKVFRAAHPSPAK